MSDKIGDKSHFLVIAPNNLQLKIVIAPNNVDIFI